jgi:hypothetical protein
MPGFLPDARSGGKRKQDRLVRNEDVRGGRAVQRRFPGQAARENPVLACNLKVHKLLV